MAKKSGRAKTIINRRAKFDYDLEDEFVVGLALTGAETKALRMGLGQLSGAYVTIKDNQLLLINATISGTGSVRINESEQTRPRQLLAKRREIDQMIEAKQQGRTIIPLEILNHGRFIKLRLATGKGKKKYDKREALRKRDEQKRIQRQLAQSDK